MNFQNNNSLTILPSFLCFNPTEYSVFPQTLYSVINDIPLTHNPICPICLNIPKKFFRPNACKHLFCKRCLYQWLKCKKSCPMCRKPFNNIIKI